MNRLLALTAVLMLFLCNGCGGDSHESLARDGLATMKEMVSVLDGVTDEASAKSAKPKLTSLMQQLNSFKERQSKLGTPTEAEFKDMEAKYGKEMEDLQMKFTKHMLRIRFDPKISAVLDDIKPMK